MKKKSSRGEEDPPIHRIDMRAVGEKEAAKALKHHHGLVVQFAKMFLPRGAVVNWIDMEDLISIGQSAVIEAVASFDESRGTKLSSWVGLIVKRRMLEMVRRCRGQTRQQQFTAINLIRAKNDPSKMPSKEDIEDLLESQRIRTQSIYEQDSFDRSLLDSLASKDRLADDDVNINKILRMTREVMKRCLSEGERAAIIDDSYDESCFSTMMDQGVSRQRVSQLKASGLHKLRDKMINVYLRQEDIK